MAKIQNDFTKKNTLALFFLPAPGVFIFVLRDGFGCSIEEPPLRPFKEGGVALTMSLRPRPPMLSEVASKAIRTMVDDAKPLRGSRKATAMAVCAAGNDTERALCLAACLLSADRAAPRISLPK